MLQKLFSPENMPISLPLLVALAVILVVFLLFRGQRQKSFALARSGAKASNWMIDTPSLSDRRTSVRREGTPVKIAVTSPAFQDGTNTGYVVDRSTGGVRVALQVGMAPGSSMQIRASHAPETTPWVTILVRSCVDSGNHFEMGCEFDKTPPWNVLLLFG